MAEVETVPEDEKVAPLTEAEMIEQARKWPRDDFGEGRWFHAMADRMIKLRGLLNIAKEEHYCGGDITDCNSPFCKAMRNAGEV